MIEFMSRQAGDHPGSDHRENSFMSRRSYAGVGPAQLGLTPVASTITSEVQPKAAPSAYG
jgi:hypothetical protein